MFDGYTAKTRPKGCKCTYALCILLRKSQAPKIRVLLKHALKQSSIVTQFNFPLTYVESINWQLPNKKKHWKGMDFQKKSVLSMEHTLANDIVDAEKVVLGLCIMTGQDLMDEQEFTLCHALLSLYPKGSPTSPFFLSLEPSQTGIGGFCYSFPKQHADKIADLVHREPLYLEKKFKPIGPHGMGIVSLFTLEAKDFYSVLGWDEKTQSILTLQNIDLDKDFATWETAWMNWTGNGHVEINLSEMEPQQKCPTPQQAYGNTSIATMGTQQMEKADVSGIQVPEESPLAWCPPGSDLPQPSAGSHNFTQAQAMDSCPMTDVEVIPNSQGLPPPLCLQQQQHQQQHNYNGHLAMVLTSSVIWGHTTPMQVFHQQHHSQPPPPKEQTAQMTANGCLTQVAHAMEVEPRGTGTASESGPAAEDTGTRLVA